MCGGGGVVLGLESPSYVGVGVLCGGGARAGKPELRVWAGVWEVAGVSDVFAV